MRATAREVAEHLSAFYAGRMLWREQSMYDETTYSLVARSAVPQLAAQLADSLAAASLQVGGFLGTDQGPFVAEVIEVISTAPLASDERFVADILTEASRLQTVGRHEQARPLAIAGGLMLFPISLALLSSVAS